MQISGKKFERAPSIRQLFPPKNLEERKAHECYGSKPLLLKDVAPSPINSTSSVPSNALEHTVPVHKQVDCSSTSVISSLQDDHQEYICSSESSSSSFPAFRKFNMLAVYYLKFCTP